jgi:hypothetical protein
MNELDKEEIIKIVGCLNYCAKQMDFSNVEEFLCLYNIANKLNNKKDELNQENLKDNEKREK